jgi:hypothetical protein
LEVGTEGHGGRYRFSVDVVGRDLQRSRRTTSSWAYELVEDPGDPTDADRILRTHDGQV